MPNGTRSFLALVVVAAAVWHVLSVLTPAWVVTFDQGQARDFASYYYAVRVAAAGGDPYDRELLGAMSRDEGTRKGVHPFLYAPPFLLTMAWALSYDLDGAYHTWFWLHELAALAAGLVLWLWWRPLGRHVGVIIVVVMALMTAIPNNHAMGQANFPGLALALAGLWQTDRRRPFLGGLLMGAACMLKMSPALFVVWWLVRREWVAAASAVLSAVLLSLLTLPLAGPAVQLGFYTRILPTFATGSYNGLGVPISLFGNHSLANVYDQWFPSQGKILSLAAQRLTSLTALGLGLAAAFLFRPRSAVPADGFARAAQASAIGVLLLLLPVYTYEHHLVFAIPAAVICLLAVRENRLPPGLEVPIGFAIAFLLVDLQAAKTLAESLPAGFQGFGNLIREAKMVALLVLGAASALAGWLPAPRTSPTAP
jgi:hypothetical protein